jgi:hypothetical protein
MSFNTFWDPSLVGATTQRADFTNTFFAGTVTGNFSAVLGGPMAPALPGGTNLVAADTSTIVNGRNNTINIFGAGPGVFNFIGNGDANVLTGNNSSIVNGANNNILAEFSLIGGGNLNCINNNSTNSVIGGGTCNAVGSIVGGALPAPHSFVGGGENNVIDTNAGFISRHNVIVGGSNNIVIAGAANASIGGGDSNRTQFSFSTVAGGANNQALDQGTTIAGGLNNIISVGQSSMIGGGVNNCVVGADAGIAAGSSNSIFSLSTFSFVEEEMRIASEVPQWAVIQALVVLSEAEG